MPRWHESHHRTLPPFCTLRWIIGPSCGSIRYCVSDESHLLLTLRCTLHLDGRVQRGKSVTFDNTDLHVLKLFPDASSCPVVHATEDIAANEEITLSYIQTANHLDDPRTILHSMYAFGCRCPGCQRPLAERMRFVARVKAFTVYACELPARMYSTSGEAPLDIIANIECNMLEICAEGYTSEISGCAHDAFQLCAFYGDGASAVRREVISRECHCVQHGLDSHGYQKSARLVMHPQSFREWDAFRFSRKTKSLRGPVSYFPLCIPCEPRSQISKPDPRSSRVVQSRCYANPAKVRQSTVLQQQQL